MRLWQAPPRCYKFPEGQTLFFACQLFIEVIYGYRDEGAEHASILPVTELIHSHSFAIAWPTTEYIYQKLVKPR